MAGLIPIEELFPQEETKPKGGMGTGEGRQDFATIAERLMEFYAAPTLKGGRVHPVSLRQLIARLSAADSYESATGTGRKGTAAEGYTQQGSGGTAHLASCARRTMRRKSTALTEEDVLAELQTRITQASILVGD